MDPPIEERIFEYARGASAAPPGQTSVVVQQVIALARGDIDVLHKACWHCEQNLIAKHAADMEGERVLALLHAAIEKTKERADRDAQLAPPTFPPVPMAASSREKGYMERVLDCFQRDNPNIRVVRLRPWVHLQT